jgi:hypothetical protein
LSRCAIRSTFGGIPFAGKVQGEAAAQTLSLRRDAVDKSVGGFFYKTVNVP